MQGILGGDDEGDIPGSWVVDGVWGAEVDNFSGEEVEEVEGSGEVFACESEFIGDWVIKWMGD